MVEEMLGAEEAKVLKIVVVGKQWEHAILHISIKRRERWGNIIRICGSIRMGKAKEAVVVAGALAFAWLAIELALKPFLTKARASVDNSDPARDPDDVSLPAAPKPTDDLPDASDSQTASDEASDA
ncbi:unnamed protein product [Sphenostylis stenocarpa]|uniref:Uncharacterized protein n=1 Tax=Sphenostylis stenocarpa TaxID=92480 RepID=A0AA86S4S9_9FABA|nr:unnamed protein product [Sphenostylis stenocarpa]